jgi:hypothetical protein
MSWVEKERIVFFAVVPVSEKENVQKVIKGHQQVEIH